jgi:(d)CTP diphosphatase
VKNIDLVETSAEGERAERQLVVAAVIETSQGLLLCRRPEDGSEPGKWELPGGKVEPGETFRHALGRELWEELRLKAEIGGVLAKIRVGHTELIFLQASLTDSGAPSLHHFKEVAFVPRAELAKYDLLEADRRFLLAEAK